MNNVSRLFDYIACARTLGRSPSEQWKIFWHQTKNLRARFHLARHEPKEVFSLSSIYGDLYFRDNFGDITNLANLIYRQTYRIKKIQPEGVILDVGANIGLAARWFAHFNPEKEIHCFEPLERNVALVKRNCPRAIIRNLALGSKPGRATLRVDKDHVMASSIPCRWDTEEHEFEVMTMDAYLQQERIEKIALLKMDVEGMELDVMEGASEALQRTSLVVMETHGQDRHQQTMERLREAGLQIDHDEFDGETGMVFASRASSLTNGASGRRLWGLSHVVER